MTTANELRDRALSAADALIAQNDIVGSSTSLEVFRTMLGMAWVEGWAAAGAEAHDVLRDLLAKVS